MKIILIAAAIFFASISTSANASGVYDGAWALPAGIFVTINQNGSSILVVVLQADDWQAELGTLVGNEATVTTIAGAVNLSTTVVFTSTTTAEITINSCAPISASCLLQAGTVLSAEKIF